MIDVTCGFPYGSGKWRRTISAWRALFHQHWVGLDFQGIGQKKGETWSKNTLSIALQRCCDPSSPASPFMNVQLQMRKVGPVLLGFRADLLSHWMSASQTGWTVTSGMVRGCGAVGLGGKHARKPSHKEPLQARRIKWSGMECRGTEPKGRNPLHASLQDWLLCPN